MDSANKSMELRETDKQSKKTCTFYKIGKRWANPDFSDESTSTKVLSEELRV